ncbi:MAG: TonB-dependent receptor [Verrucomicrobiae bacterium]|nr:TonB-dependent receptor [Verrucomicrobiae bacterium]
MSHERKPRRDRTSLIISAVLHALIIAGVGYWMHTTGRLEALKETILKLAQGEKQEKPVKEIKAVQPKAPQRQAPLPKINEGLPPPPSSGGTRRAVAADAPEAVGGGTFFADTRTQGEGPSTGAGRPTAAAAPSNPPPRVVVAPPPPPPPKPTFAPPPRATIKQLLMERAKEAAATEAVGTEQISKTGSSDAGAIVTKVSGATIVEGKFAVIRGLSDRYVTTTFNGGEIPSADPYRRSASLDLFPAQVIDRVVVAKTFTPDQQGAFTGGGINIISKSFPDRPFANFSLGGSYNTQTTGNKEYLSYKGGSLDWLGMDDGSRKLPSPLDDLNVKIPVVVANTGPNNASNPAYRDRIAQANRLDQYTKLLGTAQFAPDRGEAPPWNHNMAVSFGDTTHFLGRPLGFFGNWNYRHDYSFYKDGISRRYAPGGGGTFQVYKDSDEVLSQSVVNWGGMVSLASQWHPDHELAFNFLYNQNGIDYVRYQEGTQASDPGAEIHQNRLQFTERNLQTFQLKGTDKFPALADLKLDWLAGISLTRQYEPDVRFFNYRSDGGSFAVGLASIPDPKEPTRYWRNLDEQNNNLKLDFTLPFRQANGREGFLKAGWFASASDRTFTERQIYYPDTLGFDGNPNHYLRANNLGYIRPPSTNLATGRIRYDWMRYIASYDSKYEAASRIYAYYAMLDVPVSSRLRLVGGARMETTEMEVDSYSDIAIAGRRDNKSNLAQTDLLPAVGLIYALRTNMSLRLHYSQTIARPSFRELAGYRSYDPLLDVLLDGNPSLQMSLAQNYDLRWEWFPRPGEIYSVSFYYKSLENAIERIATDNLADGVTFINRPTATVMGIELEARKTLDFLAHDLRYFSLGGNFSYIQSETELFEYEFKNKQQYLSNAKRTRALYDQSPYILNADLSYDNPRLGTSASLILSAAGSRIIVASPVAEDVYEHPPLTLDFVLSQKLGRKATVRFTARNLLDPPYERTYGDKTGAEALYYGKYKRGVTLGLSFSYDF